MKTLLITLLLSISIFGQSGKSVLTQAQKDSIGAMIRDSLSSAANWDEIRDSSDIWINEWISYYGLDNRNYYLLFPDIIYATAGYDYKIYFDNLGIGLPSNPRVTFSPDSGDATSTYWHWTSDTSYISNFRMVLQTENTVTAPLVVTYPSVLPQSKTMLAIGDSRTATGAWVTHLKTYVGDSLSFIGTQGTPPYLHEGYGGKTYEWFCTNASSPLSDNGYVDFQGYLNDNSFDAPDFVVIRLGTNDVFSADDSDIDITCLEALEYADSLIESIHSVDPLIKIGLCLETPPANDSIFYATYGIGQTYTQYKKNIHRFNQLLKATFGFGGINEKLYVNLIPLYLYSDKDNDFANGVHENSLGYQHNAESIMSWMYGQNLYLFDGITVDASTDNYVVDDGDTQYFQVAGTSGEAFIVDWGDGTSSGITLNGGNQRILKTYTVAGTYKLRIIGWDNLTSVLFQHWDVDSLNINDMPDGLTYLYLEDLGVNIYGSLDSLPTGLTYLRLYDLGSNLTGTINNLSSSLTSLVLRDLGTSITGSISNLPSGLTSLGLTNLGTSLTGSISDLSTNLTALELNLLGTNITGSIDDLSTNLTSLTLYDLGTNITGTLSTLPTALTVLTLYRVGNNIDITSGTMPAWLNTAILIRPQSGYGYSTANIDGFLNAWALTAQGNATSRAIGLGTYNEPRSSASDAAVITLTALNKVISTTP